MANLLTRIGFIDETSVKTSMAKTTGWVPRGQRLIDHAPFGSWQTQTVIAALRHDRLDAPWVIDGPINRDLFGVTSRVIVDALPEEFGRLTLPVLECVDGRSALQG